MTNLTRPIPGDPLALSNGKSSTQIIDEIEDVVEDSEAKVATRTSNGILTTDAYSDIPLQVLNTAEATTGWHAVGALTTAGTGAISASSTAFTAVTGTFAAGNVGYGIRVPGLLISPYARTGYVDHQTLSFDAYLKFIEDLFLDSQRLDPRNDGRPDPRPFVRENVAILGDLVNDFDFNQKPRAPLILDPYPNGKPKPEK